MGNVIGARAPGWFRLLAVLGLLWNAFGVYMYLTKVGMFGDPLAGLDAAHVALAHSVPAWVTGAFAIAVFGGALGCLALLMLKRLSTWLLLISLLAVLCQDLWAFVLRTDGAAESPVLPLLVNLIALLLVWLAYHADKKGWLS
jgi:hypothetical protein